MIDYQVILIMFADILKITFPIAIIFGLCSSLTNIMLDFIFPRRRGNF